MVRRLIAGLVVVGLAIGVWLLWPEGDLAVSTTTSAVATPTTVPVTPTSSAPPAITPDPSTTSTTEDSHVVETVEEAEAILRELWFGWFEGIYNQDEDRIREVVATEESVSAAKESFGIEFPEAPSPSSISFTNTEILRSDKECLAGWPTMVLSGFREGSTEGVNVLRMKDGEWIRLSLWALQDDLWEDDCDSLL